MCSHPGLYCLVCSLAVIGYVGHSLDGRQQLSEAKMMWVCDWHRICVWGHDWVGLGEEGWPDDSHDSDRHRNVNRLRHTGRKPCKLEDPNWANDCH